MCTLDNWIQICKVFQCFKIKTTWSSHIYTFHMQKLPTKLSLRSQNTFFSWNQKILFFFFYIKLWKSHIWIYISNFMIFFLNLHMHKMCPRGPKHKFLATISNSKNARKLRFHVFFHFNAGKHIAWGGPNSQEIVNLFQFSSGTQDCNKIHNFLWIRSTSGEMMLSYVF